MNRKQFNNFVNGLISLYIFITNLAKQSVLNRMDDNAMLSVLVKCVSVLDARHWIRSSMKEVKFSTVVKCFAHCGVTGIDITEDDSDDDIPLAQLLRLTCPHIADSITNTTDYINIDNDLDANEILDTGWKEIVLTDLAESTSKVACTKDDSDEENDDDPQLELELFNNFAQVPQSIAQILQFCTSKNISSAFETLSIEDTPQAQTIQESVKKSIKLHIILSEMNNILV